jgi:hypothetical protein
MGKSAFITCAVAAALSLGVVCVVRADRPVPIGKADVTFSYMTDAGPRELHSQVDYSGRGRGDVIPLGGDPNIGYFNSVNNFGRRPLVEGGMRDQESLLAQAFFKPEGNTTEFFAGIVKGGDLTLEVRNIEFDKPVYFMMNTFLFHRLWDVDQVDLLDMPYHHVHNQDTATDPFRDLEKFIPLIFHEQPMPDYRLGTLTGPYRPTIFGEGTSTLGFRVTVPYDFMMSFEEMGQEVPPGLPAPFGFLEPFHFHYEFAVSYVPEPATGALLAAGALLALRRRC